MGRIPTGTHLSHLLYEDKAFLSCLYWGDGRDLGGVILSVSGLLWHQRATCPVLRKIVIDEESRGSVELWQGDAKAGFEG